MAKILENNIEGKIGTQKYLCTISWRNGELLMDEPENLGGKNIGPDPFSTLLASLASCTLSTLRMYIDRKEWNIPEIKISLNLYQETEKNLITTITRSLSFSEKISQAQKERLLFIADKCPISKLLKGTINIETTL
ncbi:OsmC family protein [Flavobacterium capsici]|uniref:OsmC family protein n=1 Tax=Flavobacterium capsici TaxID=3075618 RepID=A0AA96J4K6_9FLAO|nr:MULTISPECIES: OsmC family protein [unclassified Flavobacterium]WNM19234.1 OsmC family protein [Flavobacterium sp. PMR2A8]WNM20623.1 OsmC family protein [Flavobacterium sp. PMTSA4]